MALGIQRLGHVTLTAPDPAAAAAFAVEQLGFVATDDPLRLAAHGGVDAFSLEYVQGDGPGLDHAAFVVPGLDHERRLRTPAEHTLALIPGPSTDFPVGHIAPVPDCAPAPICADHVALGAADFEAEVAFATDELGMVPSARVMSRDGEVMRFLRFPGRYLHHQLVITRTPGLNHVQFTCKNLDSFYATADALREEIRSGPLRHGPAHEIAFVVEDLAGNRIEYSVEHEIVLDDDHHVPRTWSADDPKVSDEWHA
jgi:catechol 2,3-dioxygenase-like lactoylglutathione lyase family enzyme